MTPLAKAAHYIDRFILDGRIEWLTDAKAIILCQDDVIHGVPPRPLPFKIPRMIRLPVDGNKPFEHVEPIHIKDEA